MAAYNWAKIMDMKSDSELQEIINNNSENLEPEAVLAANAEVKKRKSEESFSLEPEIPEKPTVNENQQSLRKSVISLVLFIAAFYFIFRWEFKYVLILTFVIFIHELGHFIAMKIFKYKDLSIFFVPLIGALAAGQKDDISQRQNVIIALAGPLPGVLIGTILKIIGLNTGSELLARSGHIFIYLNLFNLLPIMPLDGGRIIKGLFFQSNEKINIFFIWLSIAILSYFALKAESYVLLIIPLFLFLQIKTQTQIKNFREYIRSKGIETDKRFSEITNEEYWFIRDEMAIHIKAISSLIEPRRHVPVPAENRVINMMKQIIQKQPSKDLKIGGRILFILTWVLAFILPAVALILYYINSGRIE